MNAIALAVRRAAAQGGLLATILAVTIVVSGVLVGLAGYLDLSVANAARGILSSAQPADAAARIEIKANDPDGQANAMAGLLGPRFEGTTASVSRALAIYPLPVIHASDASFPSEEAVAELPGLTVPGGDAEARLHVLADPTLPARATLDIGEWPGAGEAALNSATAELFNIRVGDVLLVGAEGKQVTLIVSGLWSANDATDAYWMGDPAIATGEGYPAGDGTRGFGPLVVDEPTLLSLGVTPTAWWTIVPDASTITPAQWQRLDAALSGLRDEVRGLPNSFGAASIISGGLAATTSDVLTGLGAIRGVTPVGLVLVGVLGAVTLVQLARLLGLARRPETALLRSRGASAAWLTTVSTLEALVVAVAGSAIGLVGAGALLHWWFGSEALTVLPWHFAAGAALTVLGVLALIAWRESARISRRDTVDDSGRARGITTMATTVLALAAAGVATWQSLLYGSPLVTDAAGRLSVNPLAVLAPALCLIAGSLLVLLALGPLSRLAEAAVARGRALQPAYSVRQVARGLVGYAAAVLVIALASGGVVVAAGYASTWQQLSERTARLVNGADVRVTIDESSVFAVTQSTPLSAFTDVPGVDVGVRTLTIDVNVGVDAELVALPASSLPLFTDGSGIDGTELAALLTTTEDVGVPLPDDATALSVDVTYAAFLPEFPPETPQILIDRWSRGSLTAGSEVWLQDAVGTIARIRLGTAEFDITADPTTATYRIDLPPGVAPWTLEGFDGSTTQAAMASAEITFENVRTHTSSGDASGTPLSIDYTDWSVWFADAYRFSVGGVGLSSTTDSITMRIGASERGVTARVSPGGNGRGWFQPFAEEPTMPIAINERLAENLAVSVGDDIVLGARGYTIPGNIVAIVPFVPGTDSAHGVVIDLNALNVNFVRSVNPVPLPNNVWVVSDGTRPLADLAAELATVGGDDTTVTTVDDLAQSAFPLPAEQSLWVAAAASLALAVISLGAVTLTIARARRGEVGVLRAVGVHAAAQARARFIEVALVVVTAIVAGALVGSVTSMLTVPGLARSVVVGAPATLPTPLSISWVTGGARLGLAAAAALVIALIYSARVRAQALDTDERLETR